MSVQRLFNRIQDSSSDTNRMESLRNRIKETPDHTRGGTVCLKAEGTEQSYLLEIIFLHE